MTDTTVAGEYRVSLGSDTYVGVEHTENEDAIWTPQDIPADLLAQRGYLFIVADGVGGYQGGKLASRTAVNALQQSFYANTADIEPSLRVAVEVANAAVCQQAQATGYADMGSTIVAAVIFKDRLTVVNVGDSRAYAWRKGRKLRQLSTDHTWVAERLAEGLINEEEAARHHLRHVITRALGQHPTVEPSVCTVQLQAGDRVLLCCDGVWEVLPEETLRSSMERNSPPQRIAQTLTKAAVSAGSPDDVSAVVADIHNVTSTGANPWGVLSNTMKGFQASAPTAFVIASIAAGVLLLAIAGLIMSSAVRGLQARMLTVSQLLPTATVQWVQTPPFVTVSSTSEPILEPLTPTETPGTAGTKVDQPATAIPTTPSEPTFTPTMTPSPTATSTPVPSPTPVPATSTPVPFPTAIAFQYCILPSANRKAPSAPAGNVNPKTCNATGEAIPVGAQIDVLLDEVYRTAECGQPVIRALYQENSYLLFPYRIGLWGADGTCTFLDWQTHFKQPRTE